MDPYALSDKTWCQEIGRRLDRLREDRKMSRDELGEELGVSQPTVRRLLDEGYGKLTILIAALRALEALDQLETFIEPPPANPALFKKKRRYTAQLDAVPDRLNRQQKTQNDEGGDLGW